MMKTSLTYEDAFAFVQARRFCVSPRIEFVRQLEAYRPILLANQAVAADRNAQSGHRARRRGREDDDDGDDENATEDQSRGPVMMRYNDGPSNGSAGGMRVLCPAAERTDFFFR